MMPPPLGDMRPTEAQLLSSPVRSEAAESARWLLRFWGLPFPRPFFLEEETRVNITAFRFCKGNRMGTNHERMHMICVCAIRSQ